MFLWQEIVNDSAPLSDIIFPLRSSFHKVTLDCTSKGELILSLFLNHRESCPTPIWSTTMKKVWFRVLAYQDMAIMLPFELVRPVHTIWGLSRLESWGRWNLQKTRLISTQSSLKILKSFLGTASQEHTHQAPQVVLSSYVAEQLLGN